MKPSFYLLSLFLFFTACHSPESEARGKHEVTATVQISPSLFVPHSERFIPNQIALFTTGTILNPASENCDVDADTICSILEIERISTSDLIAVTVHHDDEEQARSVVEAVLNSYRNYRQNLESDLAEKRLKALDQEILIQNNLVQETQTAKNSIIRAVGIPYFDDASNPLGITALDKKASAALENALKEAASLKAVLQTNLELINLQVERMRGMIERRDDGPNLHDQVERKYKLAEAAHGEARAQFHNLKIQQREVRSSLNRNPQILTIPEWSHTERNTQ